MKLHQRLQILIDGRGLQQNAVAATVGCSPQHMSNMLGGRRGITPAMLTQFLDAAGVKLPGARRDFHMHGAREAGWEISPPY